MCVCVCVCLRSLSWKISWKNSELARLSSLLLYLLFEEIKRCRRWMNEKQCSFNRKQSSLYHRLYVSLSSNNLSLRDEQPHHENIFLFLKHRSSWLCVYPSSDLYRLSKKQVAWLVFVKRTKAHLPNLCRLDFTFRRRRVVLLPFARYLYTTEKSHSQKLINLPEWGSFFFLTTKSRRGK